MHFQVPTQPYRLVSSLFVVDLIALLLYMVLQFTLMVFTGLWGKQDESPRFCNLVEFPTSVRMSLSFEAVFITPLTLALASSLDVRCFTRVTWLNVSGYVPLQVTMASTLSMISFTRAGLLVRKTRLFWCLPSILASYPSIYNYVRIEAPSILPSTFPPPDVGSPTYA